MFRLSRHGEHAITCLNGNFRSSSIQHLVSSAAFQTDTRNNNVTTTESSKALTYQTSFESFDQMMRESKQWARNSMLLALDGRDRLATIQELSSQFQTKINYCQYFGSKEKRFCLLHVDNFEPYSKIQGQKFNKRLSNIPIFPLKSRVFHQIDSGGNTRKLVKESLVCNLKNTRSDGSVIVAMSQLKHWPAQIELLTRRLLMDELELKLRFFIINQLQETLCQGVFEQFEILPFGSSVNSFGKRNSDLDLVLVPRADVAVKGFSLPVNWQPFCRLIENDRFLTQRCISILHDQIQLIPGSVKVLKIPGARVPIVKFTSNLTDIDVDVSIQFNRDVGAWSIANVLFECSRICPPLIQLVTFLRQWAKAKELTNKVPGPWITNFSLIMLLVGYLQIRSPSLLPPIKQMGILPGTSKNDFSEYVKAGKETDFAKLLSDFFLHLSKFDFDNYGFNVYDGECIVKPDFTAMHIQNPLERDLNITKNVAKRNLNRLVSDAQESYHIIVSNHELNLNTLLSTCNGNVVLRDRKKAVKVQDLFEMN